MQMWLEPFKHSKQTQNTFTNKVSMVSQNLDGEILNWNKSVMAAEDNKLHCVNVSPYLRDNWSSKV